MTTQDKTGSLRSIFGRYKRWLAHEDGVICGCPAGAITGAIVGTGVGPLLILTVGRLGIVGVTVAVIVGAVLGALTGLWRFWDSLYSDLRHERELQDNLDALVKATCATARIIEQFDPDDPFGLGESTAGDCIVAVCSSLGAIPSKEESVRIWVQEAANICRIGYEALQDALEIVKKSVDPDWEPDPNQSSHQARYYVEQMLAELSKVATCEVAADDYDD